MVAARKAEDLFAYLNITHRNAATFPTISRMQASFIGYETRSDHPVIIQTALGQSQPALTAEVVDLHTLARVREPPVILTPGDAAALAAVSRPQWLLYSLSLAPNALTLGADDTQRVLLVDGKRGVDEHDVGTVPRIISGLSVNTVDHPLGFEDWDFGLRFYLTLDVGLWHLRVRPELAAPERDFRSLFVYAPYNAALSAVTPIGAFGLSFGLGPMPTLMYRDGAKLELLSAARAELSWTVFMSRELFAIASVDQTVVNKPLTAHGVSVQRWREICLGLGYFTNSLQKVANRIIGRGGTAAGNGE